MIRSGKERITRRYICCGFVLSILVVVKASFSTQNHLRSRSDDETSPNNGYGKKNPTSPETNKIDNLASRRGDRLLEKDTRRRKTHEEHTNGDENHHAVTSINTTTKTHEPGPRETGPKFGARSFDYWYDAYNIEQHDSYNVNQQNADPYAQTIPVPSSSYSFSPTTSTTADFTLSLVPSTSVDELNPSTGSPTTSDASPTETPSSRSTLVPSAIILGTEDPTVANITPEPTVVNSNSNVLSYQDQRGICSGAANGIGCASEDPEEQLSGNPNEIVNCFNVTEFGVELPFMIDSVRFWIGSSSPPPPDLELNVFAGTKENGPDSNILLYSQQLFGYTTGINTITTTMDVMIFLSSFCVGVTSRSSDAGLRIQTDDLGIIDNASYLRSPECGIANFTSLGDVGLTNDFCIKALVSFGLDLCR